MRLSSGLLAILGAAALIASCAPKPAPIVAEPVYDKYGNAVQICLDEGEVQDPNRTLPPLPRCEDLCEPDQRPTFTVPGQPPVCEEICDPGEQPTFSVAGQPPVCVPIPDGGDDPQRDPQRPRIN